MAISHTLKYFMQWGREERARVDREAAWMSSIQGRDIVRRGRCWAR